MELKPCPCCGYEAVMETMTVRKGWEADVHCNGCLLSMHTITYDTEAEAVAHVTADWNRRAADVVPVVRGEWEGQCGAACSLCGYIDVEAYTGRKPSYCPGCGALMEGGGQDE